jgi:four helix bundle protein
MENNEPLIPPHGGYRKLKSFQLALLAYDITVNFCNQHVDRRSRTHDQMVQAARSGVQNIAEGSVASGTSKKTELKLTNVARASLEEFASISRISCANGGCVYGRLTIRHWCASRPGAARPWKISRTGN